MSHLDAFNRIGSCCIHTTTHTPERKSPSPTGFTCYFLAHKVRVRARESHTRSIYCIFRSLSMSSSLKRVRRMDKAKTYMCALPFGWLCGLPALRQSERKNNNNSRLSPRCAACGLPKACWSSAGVAPHVMARHTAVRRPVLLLLGYVCRAGRCSLVASHRALLPAIRGTSHVRTIFSALGSGLRSPSMKSCAPHRPCKGPGQHSSMVHLGCGAAPVGKASWV